MSGCLAFLLKKSTSVLPCSFRNRGPLYNCPVRAEVSAQANRRICYAARVGDVVVIASA